MTLIFGSMLSGFLSTKFDPEIKKKASGIVDATIEVYSRISSEVLPTPARFHYTFNLRDVSKVFQGILMITSAKCTTTDTFVRLWLHECQRVFYDRLINSEDQQWFEKLSCELLSRHLRVSWEPETVFNPETPVLFCDFLRPGAEVRLYEESTDMHKLQQLLDDSLDEYNVTFANQMKLVFFSDAMIHVARISRILRQPRGNAMLVGVGGSGKQSLTRIASFVAGYECVQIEINRGYGLSEFREDIKSMMIKAGVQGNRVTFLFTDSQIVVGTMLEDINNLLNSGEVPNLFAPDEQDKIASDMIPVLKEAGIPETRDNCLATFVTRVRDNLHVVLCMSPVGDALRVRCRNFPSLINCTTVDWFFPWPETALLSVAQRFIEGVPLPSDDIRKGLIQLCGVVHTSIAKSADQFFTELRRKVYITPKSYLDLINSYTVTLAALQSKVDEKSLQMEVGVRKLKETNAMVEGLKAELSKLEPILEEKSKAAVILLAQVEVDKAAAAIVKERVSKEEAIVGVQASEVAAVQADAQADLDVALPALEKALKALDSLTKADITEVKSFAKPPEAVQTVMEAVCCLFDMKPDWDSAKKLLGDSNFMENLKTYDKDNIKESVLKKVRVYTANPIMQVEGVAKVSKAATGLCMFVHAMDVYSKVIKEVAPKKARVAEMSKILAEANATLQGKRSELAAVNDRVAALEAQCEETINEKERLAAEADTTACRLVRAEKLTSGLASEGVRWEATLQELGIQRVNVIGDAFLACACVSYYGPFTGVYREDLVTLWMQRLAEMGVPCSANYSLMNTLSSPVEVQEWQNQSLPTDKVSTDSAILVTKGSRWPLMIDPQSQAHRWIKKMHEKDDIEVTTMSNINLLRTLENCIRVGKPLLIEDVGEHVEPALEPVLQKATYRQGNRLLIRIGDSSVDYNSAFKLYMTTKLKNPHYLPEVCIKVNVINFTVTMEGLEEQLLGLVVAKERPDVEKRKVQLLLRMAEDKKQLQDLEAKILELLSKSSGNILDDELLINTLADSKTTSSIIKERVEESEKTELEINTARNGYRTAATRGSLIYFVISDLSGIDPMYQYSLQYYQILIDRCIDGSEASDNLPQRLDSLINYTTATVFENICRGLFEKDKLLFSALICFQILRHRGSIAPHEWALFLRGAGPVNRSEQPDNPKPDRLTETQWDLLTATEERLCTAAAQTAAQTASAVVTLPDNGDSTAVVSNGCEGLCESITELWDLWCTWADSDSPAIQPLPADFDERITDFQKLLLIKAFREDQLLTAIGHFVASKLGNKFASSPSASMEDIYRDLDNKTPCIFILSKGADPTAMLLRFAAKMGYADKLSM
jgi:dynein heavy chain, axonemal